MILAQVKDPERKLFGCPLITFTIPRPDETLIYDTTRDEYRIVKTCELEAK